jgi:hypothetical protein
MKKWTGDTATAALALLIAVLLLAPLVRNAYLPLEDLPNHIARRFVAANLDGPLSEYFTYSVSLTTNVAVDMLWLALGQLATDAATFSRAVIAMGMVGFVASVAVLYRVLHKSWSVWSLASALLVHNAALLWGFENFYLFSMFVILGFAAWVGYRGRPILHAGSALLFSVVLYVGHVLDLLAFACIVTSYELSRFRRSGWLRPASMSWPALLIVGSVVLAALAFSAPGSSTDGYGAVTTFGHPMTRLSALLSPFGRSPAGDELIWLLRGGVLILAMASIAVLLKGRFGFRLKLARDLALPLSLFGLLTLMMPSTLAGVAFVHIRFPALWLALAIGATKLECNNRNAARALSVLLVVVVTARTYVFDRAAHAYSADIADLKAVAADLPAGSRVIPVRGDRFVLTTFDWHTAAYLVPFAQAFVPTLFVRGSHPLHVTEKWKHLSAPQPSSSPARAARLAFDGKWPENSGVWWNYLEFWDTGFSYILLSGEWPEGVRPLSAETVKAQGAFTLLRIRDVKGADGSLVCKPLRLCKD